VPYFSFLGLRFDHNAVLGALWAATTLCFIRAFETRSPAWSAAAGAAAAAAMLGKYWSIILLAGLAMAALTDTRRARYFRSAAPWITVAVGALLLAPHCVWLVTHDFIPMTYAFAAHGAKTLGQTMTNAASYLAGGAAYAAVPVLLVLALTRPSGTALTDALLPRTPRAAVRCGCILGDADDPGHFRARLQIRSQSDMDHAGLILMPVILLSSPLLVVSRQAIDAIVAVAVALPPVMLAVAPAMATRKTNFSQSLRLMSSVSSASMPAATQAS